MTAVAAVGMLVWLGLLVVGLWVEVAPSDAEDRPFDDDVEEAERLRRSLDRARRDAAADDRRPPAWYREGVRW